MTNKLVEYIIHNTLNDYKIQGINLYEQDYQECYLSRFFQVFLCYSNTFVILTLVKSSTYN